MSSSNNREDLLSSFTINNHSQSSSPITVADSFDTYLEASGSASGSFQGEGLLSGDGFGATDADHGFSRYDFRQSPLVGTVQFYERHVFLCYKNPKVWPPRIETTEFDRLPRLLSAAVGAKKAEMRRQTRLTICEGHDGTETSNGDVLIFPDMLRYRRLTHFDVETFVEEVLVKDGEWLPGNPETLHGSYVFICSHGSRDRRCGVCGPALVARFREEIESRSLQGNVSASPCSHIGGHKYAGNVIIFGRDATGVFAGHWYGYVAPEDVPELIEQHILKGEIVDRLWRGQMGLSEEEQTKSQEERLIGPSSTKGNGVFDEELPSKQQNTSFRSNSSEDTVRFCGNGESCCQNTLEKSLNPDLNEVKSKSGKKVLSRTNSSSSSKGGGSRVRKVCNMPTWLETWEQGDTYAALAVVFAAASVGVSYSLYKKLD